MRDLIGPILSCCVGWYLLASAWTKLRHRAQFQAVFESYFHTAQHRALAPAGWVGPLEGLLALGLLALWDPLVPWAHAASIAFLLLASTAVAVRVARGERRFRCGCGLDLQQTHRGWVVLARNMALTLLLAASWVLPRNMAAFPMGALPLYLVGIGALAASQLAAAIVRGEEALREWKASGSIHT